MPIYEYECNHCKHRFEYLVMGGREPEACPDCQATGVTRKMSACGFVSKGSGGETVSTSAANSSCSGCTTSSCAGCGS